MMYIFMLIMLGCGYYTVTYGINQIKDERNKLGGIATIVLTVVGTIAPMVLMYIQE